MGLAPKMASSPDDPTELMHWQGRMQDIALRLLNPSLMAPRSISFFCPPVLLPHGEAAAQSITE